ncbi:MAG: MYG1 family protein [Candidatus Paceibacteria bacterium]
MSAKILVTHNGAMHGDDLFACAVLCLYLEKRGEEYRIIRSRDLETIERGDFVFDVGGVYDPLKNRFDHHQKESGGARKNGVPYASFGLVWKHFGLDLCDGDQEAWQMIDDQIASPIDATDNGFDLFETKIKNVAPYFGERTFLIFSPTWREETANIDDIFKQEVKNIMRVLKREIEVVRANSIGRAIIMKAYEESKDKRIVELPNNFPRYLYQDTLSRLPEPIYMVCQSKYTDSWKVEAISIAPGTMQSRKLFPESWRGLLSENGELAKISGVPDAGFCHRNGFLADAKTKEGALKLAELALTHNEKKNIWRSLMK